MDLEPYCCCPGCGKSSEHKRGRPVKEKIHPDTKRLQKLIDGVFWDGEQYTVCLVVKTSEPGATFTPEPTLAEFRKAIDALTYGDKND